jgi:hypothetical protein
VDIELDSDANKENLPDVFLTPPAPCSPHPRHYNGYFYQLVQPATPTAAPKHFSLQFPVHHHATMEALDEHDDQFMQSLGSQESLI